MCLKLSWVWVHLLLWWLKFVNYWRNKSAFLALNRTKQVIPDYLWLSFRFPFRCFGCKANHILLDYLIRYVVEVVPAF